MGHVKSHFAALQPSVLFQKEHRKKKGKTHFILYEMCFAIYFLRYSFCDTLFEKENVCDTLYEKENVFTRDTLIPT